MINERLVIENFGPIKFIDLNLGKITILIGEQATGKSTIAKVLAICRYFSYIVNYSIPLREFSQFHENEQFVEGLRDWGIEDFLSTDSRITYENLLYKLEVKNRLEVEYEKVTDEGDDYKKEYFRLFTKLTAFSESFKGLLNQLEQLKNDEVKTKDADFYFFGNRGWTPNENFYRLNVKKIMDNPMYIPTERVLQSISFGNNLLVSNSLQHELSKLSRITRESSADMIIEPLSLIYRNRSGLGYVKKENEKEYHLLHNGASGFQSTIPIVLALKFYSKRKRTFIVEEPEINLFPKAQKKLMEFFVQSVNDFGQSFLLPTHSPYVLSSLNNMIYAYSLGNVESGKYRKKVNEIIPEKFWINAEDVSAYYLKEDIAVDIMNREESLIKIDDLDNVSEIINREFDELLNIEVENEC
ncbi:MAG: AAA family ATPase [Flavobacterium sp.]